MNLYHVYSEDFGDIGDLLIKAYTRNEACVKAAKHIKRHCKEKVDQNAPSVYLVSFDYDNVVEIRDV